jgi:NitT/TauT family transport system substrate-binding protein
MRLHSKRALAALAPAVIGALALSACSSTPEGAGTGAGGAEVLDISVATYPGLFLGMPVYAASDKGFFTKHGLNAELVPVAGGPNQVSAVASGSLDIFSYTVNSIMALRAQGQDFRMVVNNQPKSMNVVIGSKDVIDQCATATDPYPNQIKCMAGHTVGVPQLGGDIYWVLRSLMEDAGLSIEDVELVAVGASSNLPAAFQSGNVEFAVGVEPAPATLNGSLGRTTTLLDLSSDEVGSTFDPWVGQSFYATKSALDANPAKYERFRDAIAEATLWLQDPENSEEVAALAVKHLGIDQAAAQHLATKKVNIFADKLTCDGVDKVGRWAATTGQLKETDVISCTDLVWDKAQILTE